MRAVVFCHCFLLPNLGIHITSLLEVIFPVVSMADLQGEQPYLGGGRGLFLSSWEPIKEPKNPSSSHHLLVRFFK